MKTRLEIQLFGDFGLLFDGQPCSTVDTARLQSLLAFLVLRAGKTLARSRLAFMFWPDSTESQALTNFRKLLHQLRKALPEADAFIETDAKNICWKEDASFSLDVASFESEFELSKKLREAKDSKLALEALERTVELYRGELLSGFYEDWVEEYRERLHQKCIEALEALVSEHEASGNFREAIRYARRLRQFEPTRESAHLALIRLNARIGDRARAMQCYRECVDALKSKLDVSPSEEIRALYEELVRKEKSSDPDQAPLVENRKVSSQQEKANAVELEPVAEGKRLRPLRWISVAAALAVGAIVLFWGREPNSRRINIGEKSLAILPFDNRSLLPEDRFFTDGFHDDLLTQVSKIRDIKTISRTSVMGYRGSDMDMRDIGRELGVASILEGGVQRADDEIRINVQLIDATSDTHIWAETYTRSLAAENVLEIQSEIALAVATQLRATLSPREQARIESLKTTHLTALELYFQGRQESERDGYANHRDASIRFYERALELDPSFARAQMALASMHLGDIHWRGFPVDEQLDKARPLIARALATDPELSEVHAVLGELRKYENDFSAADRAFRKAIEINPNRAENYDAYSAFQLRSLRNPTEAARLGRKALVLDPLGGDERIQNLAAALIEAGKFDEAGVIVEDLLKRIPDRAQGYRLQTQLSEDRFQLDEALRLEFRVWQLEPEVPSSAYGIGRVYRKLGEIDKALLWYQRSLETSPDGERSDIVKALTLEIQARPSSALDVLLAIPQGSTLRKSFRVAQGISRYALLSDRVDEGIAFFEENHRSLFQADASVDPINYILVLSLAELLVADGREPDRLLRKSLEIAQQVARTNLRMRNHLWDAKLHLLLGDEESALETIEQFAEAGGMSSWFDDFREQGALNEDPRFLASVKIVESNRRALRKRVAELEERGEIPSL